MNRSTSFAQIHSTSIKSKPPIQHNHHLQFKAFMYVNTEQATKQKHTIFHSPYKGGRKNPNFANPSFMSSDIFYPAHYSINNRNKSKPKVALLPTKNKLLDEQKFNSSIIKQPNSKALFHKTLTISKSTNQLKTFDLNLEKQLQKNRSKPRTSGNVLRRIEENKQLKRQLQLMKQSPYKQKQKYLCTDNPIYLERKSSIIQGILKKHTSKRQLVMQMNKALQRKENLKCQKQNHTRQDKLLIDNEIQTYFAGIRSNKRIEKQRAKLLNELLAQQILRRN